MSALREPMTEYVKTLAMSPSNSSRPVSYYIGEHTYFYVYTVGSHLCEHVHNVLMTTTMHITV